MPMLVFKKIRKANTLHLFAIFLICIFYLKYSNNFEVFEGGRDNYAHYFISKYSWQYPYLLLDHWGKPIFTLLSSFFAQFGIKGIIFFNCILGGLTAFITYRISYLYVNRIALITIFFLLFSPIFMVLMMSAMTEVLAAFILIIGLYLFQRDKYHLGASLFSSIVLVRTEMFVIMPFLALFLIIRSQKSSILFLGLFPLIYTVIGGIYYEDILWLFTKIPYLNPSESYGKGSILHYILNFHILLGWPFLVALSVGIVSTFILFKDRSILHSRTASLLALVTVLWIAITAAHSYAYYTGGKASLGLLRVLGPVIPLMCITASIGVYQIYKILNSVSFLKNRQWIVSMLLILGIMIQLIQPWNMLPIPYRFDEKEKTMIAALNWVKSNTNRNLKIRYFDMFVPFYLQLNPFDENLCIEGFQEKNNPGLEISHRDLIIYDTRFGANEGGIDPKNILENNNLLLVNFFEPILPEFTLNELEYRVFILRKNKSLLSQNKQILDSLKSFKYSTRKQVFDTREITIQGDEEFYLVFEDSVSKLDINFKPNILYIEIGDFRILKSIEGLDFCISFESNDSIKDFKSIPLQKILKRGSFEFYLNGIEVEYIKFFLWNTTHQKHDCHLKGIKAFLVEKIY